jgi:sugar lactone lactonase YvrE
MNQPEAIVNIGAALGEGPSWDEKENVLYWTDILGKRIYRYRPADGEMSSFQLEQYVGAVVPRQSGGLALAAQRGFYSFEPTSGTMRLMAIPAEQDPDLRFNDGKCDPAGRFWAGTTSLTDRRGAAALYRMDPDGSLHRMLEGVSISNGLGWSPDGSTMYYIDTPTRTVAAFDYDMDTGAIRNKRTALEIPEAEGDPDGMTVDEEGKLWIAHWGGFQVARWDPVTGQKISGIRLPVPLVTSCVFGGKERNELFITTARISLSEEQLEKYPLSGAVFKVVTEVTGAKTYAFGG